MNDVKAGDNLCSEAMRQAILARYRGRTAGSRLAHERAGRVLPGGVNRNIVAHAPYPIFVASGAGAHLTDVDGNLYLDLIGNYTSMILGNCVPEIMRAAEEQIRRGTAWAAASAAEAVLAELILERLPAAERVRFTASGTEATMMALRAARAFTGRDRVAKFEGGYHGLGDHAMVGVAPPPAEAGAAAAPAALPASGVPQGVAEGVVMLPFNDPAAVEAVVGRHVGELAAIIVEPVMGVAGTIAPEAGFLDGLRQLATRHGILLIFDEIISFRIAHGGAQEFYGVAPDLTTLGKIIGGGYPIGAVAGRAQIMELFNPMHARAVTLSGTFHANPVALAAGAACLRLLDREAIAELNRRTERTVAGMKALFARTRRPLQAVSVGSLFNIHATEEPVTDYRSAARSDRDYLKWLHLALLNEGMFMSPRGMGCLSVPMTDRDLDDFLQALEAALAATGNLSPSATGPRVNGAAAC